MARGVCHLEPMRRLAKKVVERKELVHVLYDVKNVM